jgi:DNA-binding response OmpR family regulator
LPTPFLPNIVEDGEAAVEARNVVLVVHEDGAVTEGLRKILLAHRCAVETCMRSEAAIRTLETSEVATVIIGWESPAGRGVYRWVARHRRDLRRRFVVLRRDLLEHQREAARQRNIVGYDDRDALIERVQELLGSSRPRLLLVDDDPCQLRDMALLLQSEGFDVVPASCVASAVAHLDSEEVDLVLSDWQLGDGSGEDLHNWIARSRPALLGQLCFITGGSVEEARRRVKGVPVLPKGQDSPHLLRHLDRALNAPH